MADLTVQQVTTAGVAPTFAPADVAGDSFTNDGRTFLHVKNGGASSIDVTIDSVEPCNYGYDHDQVVTVAAGEEKLIGPFSVSRYNDKTTGKVSVSYSDVTSVTVAAIKV